MRSSLIVLCMLFCISIKASDESDGLVVKSFDKFTFNSYNDVDIKRLYNKQKIGLKTLLYMIQMSRVI